jgi:hypothetical protein
MPCEWITWPIFVPVIGCIVTAACLRRNLSLFEQQRYILPRQLEACCFTFRQDQGFFKSRRNTSREMKIVSHWIVRLKRGLSSFLIPYYPWETPRIHKQHRKLPRCVHFWVDHVWSSCNVWNCPRISCMNSLLFRFYPELPVPVSNLNCLPPCPEGFPSLPGNNLSTAVRLYPHHSLSKPDHMPLPITCTHETVSRFFAFTYFVSEVNAHISDIWDKFHRVNDTALLLRTIQPM